VRLGRPDAGDYDVVPASVAARRVKGRQRASAGLFSQFRWSTLLLGFTLLLRRSVQLDAAEPQQTDERQQRDRHRE
jgi:hypothetical protein